MYKNKMMARWLIITVLLTIIGLVSYFSNIVEGIENSTSTGTDVPPVAPTEITNNTVSSSDEKDELKYDPDNLDVDYIDESKNDTNVAEKGTAWVKDKEGNMVALTTDDTSSAADKLANNINYYEPGTYKYGSSTYVPSYEDSIYLSKTTGKSTVTDFIDESAVKGGICNHYKNMPEKLEEECGKLDTNLCAATSCCVLLGGAKCVAGNARGPVSKLHYGDITIRNRDYYYYKGKCYGNCVK
jgi:hypothetical protein